MRSTDFDTFGEISVERRKALPHLAVSGSLTGGTASGQVGSTKWVRVRGGGTGLLRTLERKPISVAHISVKAGIRPSWPRAVDKNIGPDLQ